MWPTILLMMAAFAPPHVPDTALSGSIPPATLARYACTIPDYGRGACFRFAVPENRRHPNGRNLALYVAYFPAYEPAGADAITPLDGGPGEGSATQMQGYFSAPDVRLLRKRHAMLFIDERGTGLSAAIDCPTQWTQPQSYVDEPVPLLTDPELRRCRAALAKRADLNEYNTTTDAEDIDAVRAALGIEKLTLMGFSGGTLTAQVYVRRYPARVRAIVMGGVTTPDYHHPAPSARAREIAIDEVFRQCSVDPACGARFPNLRSDFAAAVASARTHPVEGTAPSRARVTIPYPVFADRLALMLYSPAGAAKIPSLLHAAAHGNWQPFVSAAFAISKEFYTPTDRPDAAIGISKGMYLSSVCSEGVPFITAADVAATVGTFTESTRIDAYRRACAIWDVRPAPAAFAEPVVSSVPTLVISNRFDPTCPWWVAHHMLRNWPHARQVTDLTLGHLDDWDCIKKMSVRFIDALDLWSLDTSCAQHPAKVPFAS
ncbi:MAG TPA: alpha/beta hydrolase [Candidatus Acidoferrales bacterium]|jgi:pimeloyl-ACP methyl ester carboxylesterase|nr:alpha/beta hydrolase [Candidatus Acidoferrales bacterium]